MKNTNTLPSMAQLKSARDSDWSLIATEYGFTLAPVWVEIDREALDARDGTQLEPGCACWQLSNSREFLLACGSASVPVLNLVLYGSDGKGGATCWQS
mgnify:FL=1